MLSAAGQLAAHPWLYPGYLAAAAALGQSAAAVQGALQPGPDTGAVSPAASPSPRHPARGHQIVSSSSRFAPYPPGAERRRAASRQSSSPGATERSPVPLPRAATPPPAPDTTDSPPAADEPVSPGRPGDDDTPEQQLKNMEQMVNGLDHVMKPAARTVTSSSHVVTSHDDDDVTDVDSSKT